MKKSFAALALAGAIALGGASTAQALYPPLPPSATVSSATVTAGVAFTFSGQGMLPNEPVTISVNLESSGAAAAGSRSVPTKISMSPTQTSKTTADAEGKFSVPITINEPGTYSILATGDISGVTVGPVIVTVAAASANENVGAAVNGSGLANTGANSGLILWSLAGVGALAAGAASVVVVRRRANAAVSS